MKIIGLTGGIASGKSTVSRLFADLGATVLSADDDARTVLGPGSTILQAVFAAFPECRNPDGTVHRAALATRIFASSIARETLENIMHPAIFARMASAIETARMAGDGVLIYEVPLLFEKKREPLFDATIATLASPQVQRERLQAREAAAGRPPLSEQALDERLAAQLPAMEKARRADYVIRTDVPLEQTRSEVAALWSLLAAAR